MKIAPFDYQIQDFERFTNDQQFINVVDALTKIETQQGGLTPEEIWEHAIKLLESLKSVYRPEITVKRMFSYITDMLKEQYPKREKQQIEHTAYCILFCVAYILCAHDEEPDPNQDIIESICEMLSNMHDIVPLFEAVERVENEQDAKGYTVVPRNALAKPHIETAKEAKVRIINLIKQDIIIPIVNADYVQSAYKKDFANIWEDILEHDTLFDVMCKEEFGKTYNLKMVVNILAIMTYNRKVIKASNNKIANLLFPEGSNHYKYFTTDTGNTFSAFQSSSEKALINSIIDNHKI